MRFRAVQAFRLMVCNEVQFSKACPPIVSMELGNVTVVNDVHPVQRPGPVDSRRVQPLRSIVEMDVQFRKGAWPMVSREAGNETDSMPVQSLKFWKPMCVIPSSMTTVLMLVHSSKRGVSPISPVPPLIVMIVSRPLAVSNVNLQLVPQ